MKNSSSSIHTQKRRGNDQQKRKMDCVRFHLHHGRRLQENLQLGIMPLANETPTQKLKLLGSTATVCRRRHPLSLFRPLIRRGWRALIVLKLPKSFYENQETPYTCNNNDAVTKKSIKRFDNCSSDCKKHPQKIIG